MAAEAAGTLPLGGLFRVLGILGSLAHRQGVGIGCAVLGPTNPSPDSEGLVEQRNSTLELVARHTRRSDVCAWVGDADLALVTFGTDTDSVRSILHRLSGNGKAPSGTQTPGLPAHTLSAGMTALDLEPFRPSRDRSEDRSRESPRGEPLAALSQIAQAQAALRSARKAGGGIETVERT
jgi:hypothetical protein